MSFACDKVHSLAPPKANNTQHKAGAVRFYDISKHVVAMKQVYSKSNLNCLRQEQKGEAFTGNDSVNISLFS
jgi:hypothetical protein